jgi:hypothetical protein
MPWKIFHWPFGPAPSGQGDGILCRVLLQCVAASRPQTALLAAELHILELCQAIAGQKTALQLLVWAHRRQHHRHQIGGQFLQLPQEGNSWDAPQLLQLRKNCASAKPNHARTAATSRGAPATGSAEAAWHLSKPAKQPPSPPGSCPPAAWAAPGPTPVQTWWETVGGENLAAFSFTKGPHYWDCQIIWYISIVGVWYIWPAH